MSVNKQLLDPLGTLCKLVSLNFSEINTKITIHNHVLSLQKPFNYQFLIRMIYRDGKENISEIFYVIIRIIKWYLVNDEKNDDNSSVISQNPEIKRLVKYTCNALRKLQATYEYGNVILAIQFYINILEDALNGSYNDNKLPLYIIEKEREYENLLDYEKLKNFWDHKKLKVICELYDKCFTDYEDKDINNDQKAALIDGYLKSISSMLELADTEFQTLINNSNKG